MSDEMRGEGVEAWELAVGQAWRNKNPKFPHTDRITGVFEDRIEYLDETAGVSDLNSTPAYFRGTHSTRLGDGEAGSTAKTSGDAKAEAEELTEEQLRLFPQLAAQAKADRQLKLELEGLPPEAPLPVHYRLFAQGWCNNGFKGGPAVMATGYTDRMDCAYVYASRWLKNPRIQGEIAQILLDDGRLSKGALLSKLRSIIHANASDFVESADGGLELKDLTELSPDQTAAIKKVTVNTTERTKNGGTTRESTVNIELLDPLRAIEIAAKMLDLLAAERVEMTSGGERLPAGVTEIRVVREAAGLALQQAEEVLNQVQDDGRQDDEG